jgi:hypothetical protein
MPEERARAEDVVNRIAVCSAWSRRIEIVQEFVAAEVERAVREEREACAKVVESKISQWCRQDHIGRDAFCEDYGCSSLVELAAAIRARQP